MRVAVIGAGLTGLTAAHVLTQRGVDVTVYEQDFAVGGHARSASMNGVPYEPHGAHIFHTSDEVIWRLVTSLVDMLPYRHRVLTDVHGEMFSWPIQHDELHRLDCYGRIQAELDALGGIDSTNFETWCVSQMGETLYGLFIDGYTTKQWGRPGSDLAADLGPKRVELRYDGERALFRDPHQGWPADGYGALAEALAADTHVLLGQPVTLRDIPELIPPDVPVIVTAALDGFCGKAYGPLEWRGVSLVAQWLPGDGLAQDAMVVNRPSPDVSYTRTIETKHVLGYSTTRGTVLMYEYPGAPAKHYPVPDAGGDNRRAQQQYETMIAGYERNPLIPAGRLARYTYINMDQAMREGLTAASGIIG